MERPFAKSAAPTFQYCVGLERFDFALAIDDQPQRDGLHAAGREAERELRPHEGRDVVADDAIEDAAGALRVVEVGVELARVGDAVIDALLRDLVELDAGDLALGALDLVRDVEEQIASPSRSGSVARSTASLFFAAALSSSRTFSFSGRTAYVSAKSLATSTAFWPVGRSFTWPFDARTS